jgi:hypothetical protein
MTFDLRPFIHWIKEEFEPSARIGNQPGSYARKPGDTVVELYGVSDMACILYSIDALYLDEAARASWAENFHSLQNPATGWLLEKEKTHCPLHNTAFALGAMNLLSILPRYPLAFVADYATREKMTALLDSLNWKDQVYGDSHHGAGMASIMALVPGSVPPDWFEWYFEYLDALFDSRNGMMGIGKPPGGDCDQIGGTFHYAFVYEYFHRRMPYDQQRIDSILGLQRSNGEWRETNPWWLTLDAIYMLTRAESRTHHRSADVRAAVRKTLALCLDRVNDPAYRGKAFGGHMGVHTCTAAISLFAEVQQYLGVHEVLSEAPLHLVLDKRTFI